MDSIKIEGTDEFPEIVLDKENSIFKFSGKSMPEDVSEFYTPIINWITQYAENPNEKTIIDFRMVYFNTASSKKLLDVLEAFEEIHGNGSELFVNWYYHEEDEDMEEAGETFFEIVDIPFKLISY